LIAPKETDVVDSKINPPDAGQGIWIISEGRFVDPDPSCLLPGKLTGPVKEYRISDMARYLLNPEPIEVKKRLIGCEIHYFPTGFEKWRTRFRRFFPGNRKGIIREEETAAGLILTRRKEPGYEPRDLRLKQHVERIREAVRPCDPVFTELERLDPDRIEAIVGLCHDPGGNRSCITIPGTPAEQIRYMIDNIDKPVCVGLEKAHIAQGLFELNGYDFTGYNPANIHRLLKCFLDGKPGFCMVDADQTIRRVEDARLVQYMQLFEQSIRNNGKLRDCLEACIKGRLRPMKLFFNDKLEINYSRSCLPKIFKEIFDAHRLGETAKAILVDNLNHHQIGVAFHYIPRDADGEENIHTDISVMQDLRALEPIREELPLLYSELSKRAAFSEGGRFYLLETIRGVQK